MSQTSTQIAATLSRGGSPEATLTIRGLDDDTKSRLRVRQLSACLLAAGAA